MKLSLKLVTYIALAVASLTACGNDIGSGVNESDVAVIETSKNTQESLEVKEESSENIVLETKTELDIYKELVNKDDNWVFSPYSLYDCARLIYPASNGETRTELEQVFGLNDTKVEHYIEYDSNIEFNGEYGVRVTNTAYINNKYKDSINKEFIGGDLEFIDVSNPNKEVAKINSKVSDDTNGMIKDLLLPSVIGPDTSAIMVNALYFNMAWNHEKSEILWKEDHMIDSFEDFISLNAVKEYDSIDILRLKYNEVEGCNPYSLYIICDNADSKSKTVDNFMETVDYNTFNELLDFNEYKGLQGYDKTNFNVPSFKIDYKESIKDGMQKLGLNVSLSNNADFSKSGISMHISDIVQAASIDVNESGTEASAATAMIMVDNAAIVSKPLKIKTVRADDTFVFVLKDDITNDILFIGRVDNL